MEQTVIKTAEVKEKLQRCRMTSGHLDEFCRLLGDRLNEEVTPLGFLMAYNLLVMDLEHGDGMTIPGPGGTTIRTHLSGIPMGAIYQLVLPKVAQQVLPDDFCKEVLNEWEAVRAEAANR